MFKFDEKYGNININGMSIPIDQVDVNELGKNLKKLKEKRFQLIEEQNNYLSEIIK